MDILEKENVENYTKSQQLVMMNQNYYQRIYELEQAILWLQEQLQSTQKMNNNNDNTATNTAAVENSNTTINTVNTNNFTTSTSINNHVDGADVVNGTHSLNGINDTFTNMNMNTQNIPRENTQDSSTTAANDTTTITNTSTVASMSSKWKLW